MHIILINPPFRDPAAPSKWISVPPNGYGGIQWMVASLAETFLETGHHVTLLGAPGSPVLSTRHSVPNVATREQVESWLATNDFDIVHDHSNGAVFDRSWAPRFVSTHSLTGRPSIERNVVFVSNAQRQAAGMLQAPVIRVPVTLKRYNYSERKEPYLLFLGRVSRWKGAYEAAYFAATAGLPLLVAGPAWEPDYRTRIEEEFAESVRWLGTVHGKQRLDLLSRAKALMVLSQPVLGPWSDVWCEPGATVVSEAAASGTPVIASDNGCLPEIAQRVGVVIPAASKPTTQEALQLIESLPTSKEVRHVAEQEWACGKIGEQYVKIYCEVIEGRIW